MIATAVYTIFLVAPMGHTTPLTSSINRDNSFTTYEECRQAADLVTSDLSRQRTNLTAICLPSYFKKD